MNRLVREHYPVDRLPDDLREGLEGVTDVRVTIDAGQKPTNLFVGPGEGRSSGIWFSRYKHLRRANFGSSEEVDAYVQAFRDEWGDRER